MKKSIVDFCREYREVWDEEGKGPVIGLTVVALVLFGSTLLIAGIMIWMLILLVTMHPVIGVVMGGIVLFVAILIKTILFIGRDKNMEGRHEGTNQGLL